MKQKLFKIKYRFSKRYGMGFFSKITDVYEDIWRAIIRPPRDIYTTEQLGSPCFIYKGSRYFRRDFTVLNERGHLLQCSHFERIQSNGKYFPQPMPCVIYLHGNCSSRLETIQCGILRVLLTLGISVACFDFSGSGLSEGEFVSLGFYEKNDLECVIRDLRNTGRVSMIALWGRSMGAVTASLLAQEDPCIAALILDSPFSSLRCLAEELANDFLGWKVPKFILRPALNIIRSTVFTRAAFNLDDVEPIRHCEMSFIPALFIAAKNDNFVRPHHAESMHRVYGGDKNFVLVEGNHNTMRPDFLFDSISFFLSLCLKTNTSSIPLHSICDNNIQNKYKECTSNKNIVSLNANELDSSEKYNNQTVKNDTISNEKDKQGSFPQSNITKSSNFSSIISNTPEHSYQVEKKKNMTPSKTTDRNSFSPESSPYNISDNVSLTMISNETTKYNSLFLSGKTCTNISKWITETLNMTTPDVEPTFCALKEHTSH